MMGRFTSVRMPFVCLVLGLLVCPLFTVSEARAEPGSEGQALWSEARAALQRDDLPREARLRLRLYDLINQYRAEQGLYPLALDRRLNASAMAHSADMARMGGCRHAGSDGSSARHRMGAVGYPYNNWAGENIICARDTPEAALAWWKTSTPHRKNLLHQHFSHIGIGFDPDGPWGGMWTLNFAAGADGTVHPVVLDAVLTESTAAEPPEPEPAPLEDEAVTEEPAPDAAASAEAAPPEEAPSPAEGEGPRTSAGPNPNPNPQDDAPVDDDPATGGLEAEVVASDIVEPEVVTETGAADALSLAPGLQDPSAVLTGTLAARPLPPTRIEAGAPAPRRSPVAHKPASRVQPR